MPLFPAISHRSSAGWLQVLRTPPLRSGRKRCSRLLRRTGLYQKAAIGEAGKRWRRQCAKKTRPQRGGLESDIRPDLHGSPFRPAVAAPIPATFVLAERDARARPPVIVVNNYTGRRWIVVAFMAVPANWASAYNCRRCGGCGESENACARRHTQKGLVEWFHFGTPIMTSRQKNKL